MPASGANVDTDTLTVLARPYPQLVSGTPSGWSFDATSRTFALGYTPVRAGGGAPFPSGSETDIAVPAIQYPGGYVATVTGGHVTSAPNAPVLRIKADRGAASIHVSITPAP